MSAFLQQFVFLFWNVVLPILGIAACGFVIMRRHPLDLNTLAKIQVNLFMPCFMVSRVAQSDLNWSQINSIVWAMVLAEILLGLPLFLYLRMRGTPPASLSVILISAVVFNSGNYGIPLAERAFPNAGGAVQALILLVSNVTIWGLGYVLLASSNGGLKKAFNEFVRTPLFASLVLALVLKAGNWQLVEPVKYGLDTIAGGLVPVALFTLGAQLATRVRWPHWRKVGPVLVMKLILFPAVMALAVWILGLWPWPGAMLILAASAPSAVNTFILAIELKADHELAAECVFWTTVISMVTVTLTLTLLRAYGGGPS